MSNKNNDIDKARSRLFMKKEINNETLENVNGGVAPITNGF
jgi:bacteriocin-like protein